MNYATGGGRKGNKYPPERLTQHEVDAILDTCSKTKTSLRDNALLHVLARSGLRHAEALDLKPCDVNLKEQFIQVLRGKGDKSRVVGMDRRTVEALRAWREYRSTLELPRGSPFFCTVSNELGKPLTQRAMRAMIRNRTRRAGIDKRVTPHSFRHALAVALAEDNQSMVSIQQTLGHSNISTTAVYLQTINPDQGIQMIRSRE